MLVKRRTQIARCAPELSHDFAQVARQVRQLLRAKYNQDYHEDDNQVWNAEHFEVRRAVRRRDCSLSLISATRTPFLQDSRRHQIYFAGAAAGLG
jgi:hypothetical protein